MLRYIFFTLTIAALLGCNKQTSNTSASHQAEVLQLHYAKGFQVVQSDEYTHVTILNPWDSTAMLQSYVLVDRQKKELPANLPKGTIIRTPVNSIAATSALHCSVMNELNSIKVVTGVCEPEYIKNEYIIEGVANGTITNLGMANSPNPEALILLSPDLIFSDPMAGKNTSSIEKTKIPVILTTDYTEPHPLGRAEWMRFYALFVGKEALADSLFTITANNYNEVKEKVAKAENKPTVLTDLRYQGVWHLPGGTSNTATLLQDAGSKYMWQDYPSNILISLNFEAVLDKAGDADKWLVRYYNKDEMTYQSLQGEYKPYSYFKAFKDKEIYGCNTLYSTYYDDLPIHPDYILKDMAYIFHPELFPNYEPKYYKKLRE